MIKNKNIKVVFTDIDGTILHSDHSISDETKACSRRLEQMNIPIILVSARGPQAMVEIRDQIQKKSPMICYSGALLVDQDGKPLFQQCISNALPGKVLEEIRAISDQISINFYEGEEWFVQSLRDPWVCQEMDITKTYAKEDNLCSHGNVHKILCMGNAELIEKTESVLIQKFPQLRIYRSKDTYLEIISREACKSDAIAWLQMKHGWAKEEMMAFGDGHNDIDMLQYVEYGYAMGNADNYVKSKVKYETLSNDEDGVAMIINKLVQ